MVVDFLHWKMLFHGVGYKPAQVSKTQNFNLGYTIWAHHVRFQTWLSSLDIPEFLARVDSVDETNDGTMDKILGDATDDIIALPNDNEGFVAAFLEHLAMSARQAVAKKTSLVVIVLAPVTPEQDICVDFGGKKIYLTAERLCEAITVAVENAQAPPVMLITPSPFTGGWLCRPSLLNQPESLTAIEMMRNIAKSCGGAFANGFISSFTKGNSPVMTEAQREKLEYHDPMPLNSTPEQIKALHQFQRQIHESLEQRCSVFAQEHGFILELSAVRAPSSFVDSWIQYGPRQGRPIHMWANRWPSPRPTIDDPHRFEFLGEAFGGTKDSQFFHLKYLAAIELDTCPGDWDRQVGGITRELLTSFSQRLMPGEDDAKRVLDTIEFRSSCMITAQMVAKVFGLPLPDGVKCRYWHDKMDGVSDEYYKNLRFAFSALLNLFDQAALLPGENRHEYKNVRFWRASRWLSAAIALQFEGAKNIENFVQNNVAKFITKIRETQKTLLVENQAVSRAGMNWIAALGLGGEVAQPTATPAVVAEAEAVGSPHGPLTTGPVTKNNPGDAAKTAALNAQADPWPGSKVPLAPGDDQWEQTDKVAAGETSSAVDRPHMTFAEAESGLAQGDMHRAVEDFLEDFGTQPAEDSKHFEHQIPTDTATSTLNVRFEDKQHIPATGADLQQATNMTFPSKGTGKERGGSFANKNSPKAVTSTLVEKEAVVATATDSFATLWQMASKRDREKLLKGDIKKADELVAPYELTLSTPSQIQKTAACVFEAMLAVLSTSSQDDFTTGLARVVQKALDNMNQAATKKPSDNVNEYQIAELPAGSVHGGGNRGEVFKTFTDKVTSPVELPADSPASIYGTGKGLSTKEATPVWPVPFTVGHLSNRHSRMESLQSLDARMQSLSIHDSAPAYAPVAGPAADQVSGETQSWGNLGTAPSVAQGAPESNQAAAQGDAMPKQAATNYNAEATLAGDDFWDLSGISWG